MKTSLYIANLGCPNCPEPGPGRYVEIEDEAGFKAVWCTRCIRRAPEGMRTLYREALEHFGLADSA